MREVKLERRHFEFFADFLNSVRERECVHPETFAEIVEIATDKCRRTNSNFDADRFIVACNKDRVIPPLKPKKV